MTPPLLRFFGVSDPPSVTYDSSGNRTKEDIKDPQQTLTKTVSYQYDILGRLYRINNPDSNYAEYSYDVLGNRLSFKDPKGNPLTYYEYDPLGRLKEVIQPGDIHTLYIYDSRDTLESVTDGNGNSTTYVLDDMGRVYQEISPDRGTTTYQYDPADNVIAKTARGLTINFQYDALNRLILKDFPNDVDFTYVYDNCLNGKGMLCQVVDASGSTTRSYSPKGQLLQEQRVVEGVNYTTGYQYDDNGNLEVLTYPSGRTVTYVYDNGDQVTEVLTTPFGGVQQTVASSISYYPFGDMGSLTYGNSLVRTVTYDLQYRFTGIQTGAVQDITYVPEPNGNVQDIIDNLDSNKNRSFSYDSLDRLEGSTGPWGVLAWTYDGAGNRLTSSDAGGITNYSYYAGNNRLESLSGATSVSFTYDVGGNTQTEGTRQYVYDDEGRLTGVIDVTSVGEYSYNGLGQRASKAVGGATTVFHYDKAGNIIGESDGVEDIDYILLDGEPFVKANGSEDMFIINDHMGTPTIMADSSGAVVWEMEAMPFGDGNITGSAVLNLRFPGQYYDDESGLHYNYFRDYHPTYGRYIEPDPMGAVSGEVNLYTYVKNNPINFTDISGLFAGQWIQCGPCWIRVERDPHKGKHAHWECRGGSTGCVREDGQPCENSGPVPPRVRKCLEKKKFFKDPQYCPVRVDVPAPSPEAVAQAMGWVVVIVIVLVLAPAGM